ncbi:MAG: class I SAM-dependent methyltransferase [Xanthomonadales bacterium]|nr:class I SAM-dependent methyltransferase [Xanthomonadales bacterium]
MPVNSSDHWSEYWAQGRLTSLPQDFAANYDGEVAEFWNEVFEKVPEGGHVLDLCTGNGAVALLAAAYFNSMGRKVAITAVDAAKMDMAAVAQQFPVQSGLASQVDFVADCPVENLQFPDQSADLVTSQYGVEYCDWEPAARQVFRVLKPAGRFQMVCHTPSSDMLAYMNREHAEYARLEELGFFSAVDDYVDGRTGHEALKNAFSTISSRLEPEFSSNGSALFGSVLGLLRNALDMTGQQLDSNREALQAYRFQMQAGRDRLADMLRVNQALDDDPDWTGVFVRAGLEQVRQGQIRYRGQHNAGQYYEFRKPQEPADQNQDG